MFGTLSTGVLELGSNRIVIEDRGSSLLYRRIDLASNSIAQEMLVSKNVELRLTPIYPVFYPKFVTQYMLCVLDKSITLAPGETLDVFASIPIDLAVYAYTPQSFRILDIVPLHSEIKYVLYGSIDSGTIARLCTTSVHTTAPPPQLGYAIARLVIKNGMGKIVSVTKILLDASPLRLYYRPGTWEAYTQTIYMNIVGDTIAIVSYGSPFIDGVEPIDDPDSLRPPRIYNRTEMLQGY